MTSKDFHSALLEAQSYMLEGWSFYCSFSLIGINLSSKNFKHYKKFESYKSLHKWYYQDDRKCTPPLTQKSTIPLSTPQLISGITGSFNATT